MLLGSSYVHCTVHASWRSRYRMELKPSRQLSGKKVSHLINKPSMKVYEICIVSSVHALRLERVHYAVPAGHLSILFASCPSFTLGCLRVMANTWTVVGSHSGGLSGPSHRASILRKHSIGPSAMQTTFWPMVSSMCLGK